ncbi:hypothetical protein APHWI1_0691 [Anaplasma phagocytophilum str. ApWI1]|uniref:Uncharacterized protein n=2 Tax=Anaplasma phagocytophilum TaxID=948 RepID=A0A0F3MY15_ANAPH|nr:hypothetical protein EPHNCH_1497 [Anaplasma phagocytophilum str. NCH-1]KJV84840.1 hypothetical protein APHWI1_0691 [Anaplasma phagocytophilum str. ApWI1]KJV87219.1 hypothetical protein APHNYW_1200 [Anaplasma phagocytophilum str. ApNYW]KKA00354.1 hypothetical protein APHDU1_0467 [Anaplasma phagocytophilum]
MIGKPNLCTKTTTLQMTFAATSSEPVVLAKADVPKPTNATTKASTAINLVRPNINTLSFLIENYCTL